MSKRLEDQEVELMKRVDEPHMSRRDPTNMGGHTPDADYAALLAEHEKLQQELLDQQEVRTSAYIWHLLECITDACIL